MKNTIKRIYNWDKIENPETSLLKQINIILEKTPDELNCSDICLLLRQEMFLDLVVPKAIKEINKNPKIGDYYDFQMLVNLSNLSDKLIPFKTEIQSLANHLETIVPQIEFELDSDKDDFKASISKLKSIK